MSLVLMAKFGILRQIAVDALRVLSGMASDVYLVPMDRLGIQ